MFGPPLYCPDDRHPSWCVPKVQWLQWLQCGAGPRLGRRQQWQISQWWRDGASQLSSAGCTHSGHRVSTSIIFDKLLFDGDCWTVWTPCTVLRAGAGQHSKLQTGPSSNIRTPPGPGRGRHRHANCGFRHKQLYERATFFCILTFFGWIVGKYISHDPSCSQLSNSSNDTFHKYLLCWSGSGTLDQDPPSRIPTWNIFYQPVQIRLI